MDIDKIKSSYIKTPILSVTVLVAMVFFGGFLGVVSTTDWASWNANAAISLADATYNDVLKGYVDETDVIDNYWKMEPIVHIVDLEVLVVRWHNQLTERAEDTMKYYYQQYPKETFLWGEVYVPDHTKLIEYEANLASSTVDIGSVTVELAVGIIDTIGWVVDYASSGDTIHITGVIPVADEFADIVESGGYIIAGDCAGKKTGEVSDAGYTIQIFDYDLDMQDVTYLKNMIFGYVPKALWADANQDGKISMLDVTQVKLLISGSAAQVWLLDPTTF